MVRLIPIERLHSNGSRDIQLLIYTTRPIDYTIHALQGYTEILTTEVMGGTTPGHLHESRSLFVLTSAIDRKMKLKYRIIKMSGHLGVTMTVNTHVSQQSVQTYGCRCCP